MKQDINKLNWFEKNILRLKEVPILLTQDEHIDESYYTIKKSIYNLMNSGISIYEEKELIKILRKIDKIQQTAESR